MLLDKGKPVSGQKMRKKRPEHLHAPATGENSVEGVANQTMIYNAFV